MVLNWFNGFFSSIFHEIQSRKFRAFLLAILAILTSWLQGVVTPEQAIMSLVIAVAAYIMGVAVEDGLKG